MNAHSLSFSNAYTVSIARIASRFLVGVIVLGASACGDATAPTAVPDAPFPVAPTSVVRMRGTVDVATGTLTFDPLGSGTASSLAMPSAMSSQVRTQMFGDQGLTVRLYSSAVTVVNPSSPGKKTYSGAVGLRNLLPHSIGDEQSSLTPLDTMGIFVVFTAAPTVRAPSSCPGCTVTVLNADGVEAFDAPNEQYFYWNEHLQAAGSGFDTTRTRRTWTFEASTAVTNFSFEVLVSAAWPQPLESVWRASFGGDSLPDTQSEPRWRRYVGGSGTSASASAGALSIATGATNNWLTFLRQDSVAPATSVYMEGRFRLDAAPGSPRPFTGMMIDDDARTIGVGLSGSVVGFTDGSLSGFLPGGTVSVTTGAYHTYQLRKFGADSAQIWVDGARVLSRPYAQFDASTQTLFSSFVSFGSIAQKNANTATYDYVSYVIGQPTP